jgi:hypothetical protein
MKGVGSTGKFAISGEGNGADSAGGDGGDDEQCLGAGELGGEAATCKLSRGRERFS